MLKEQSKYTPEEYLAREEKADYKSEYYDGEILMMSGGTPEHSIIKGNVVTALNNALVEKPCTVFDSDMLLHITNAREKNYAYPDAMVICGKTELQFGRRDVVLNPVVIVEVLSRSTREHDRIEKFKLYKQLASLREYVLVDSERIVVSVLRREGNTGKWTIEFMNDLTDILILESLEIEIPISLLYAKIDFQTSPESDAE